MRNTTTISATTINVAFAREIRNVVVRITKSLRSLLLDARYLMQRLAGPAAMCRRARRVGSSRLGHVVTWLPARGASEAVSSTL